MIVFISMRDYVCTSLCMSRGMCTRDGVYV